MRTKLMMFVAAVAALVAMAPAASADTPVTPGSTVVYWQGAHAAGLNTACAAGTKTQFIVHMRVPAGASILGYDNFKLRLKSGADKYGTGVQVTARHVEFYVMAGRYAKADLAHPHRSYAYPVNLSVGAENDARIRIQRNCVATTP